MYLPPKFTTKTDVLLFLVFRKFILVFWTSGANVVTWNAGYARKCTIF